MSRQDGEVVIDLNVRMCNLVAFGLPCMLYIAPIIRGDDVEYQAYPGVNHS